MRVLPDTIALLSRLARDRSLPLSTRAPIWALAGYLASVSARESPERRARAMSLRRPNGPKANSIDLFDTVI
jgi:hypothetical protein